MKNYYLYYRLLFLFRKCSASSTSGNDDILIYLRNKSSEDLGWTEQQTQDFFENLASESDTHRSNIIFSEIFIDYKVEAENTFRQRFSL